MPYYMLPVFIGLLCYAGRLWPSYVPDELGYALCALPVVPYLLDRFVGRFSNISREVAGVCYLILACLAVAKWIEVPYYLFLGIGIMLGLVAILVVWEDAIRYGSVGRFRYRSIFLAVFVATLTYLGTMETWNQEWARIALPLSATATCVTLLLNHRSVNYLGTAMCLIFAVAIGFEAPEAPALWCLCFMSLKAAHYSWQGYFLSDDD